MTAAAILPASSMSAEGLRGPWKFLTNSGSCRTGFGMGSGSSSLPKTGRTSEAGQEGRYARALPFGALEGHAAAALRVELHRHHTGSGQDRQHAFMLLQGCGNRERGKRLRRNASGGARQGSGGTGSDPGSVEAGRHEVARGHGEESVAHSGAGQFGFRRSGGKLGFEELGLERGGRGGQSGRGLRIGQNEAGGYGNAAAGECGHGNRGFGGDHEGFGGLRGRSRNQGRHSEQFLRHRRNDRKLHGGGGDDGHQADFGGSRVYAAHHRFGVGHGLKHHDLRNVSGDNIERHSGQRECHRRRLNSVRNAGGSYPTADRFGGRRRHGAKTDSGRLGELFGRGKRFELGGKERFQETGSSGWRGCWRQRARKLEEAGDGLGRGGRNGSGGGPLAKRRGNRKFGSQPRRGRIGRDGREGGGGADKNFDRFGGGCGEEGVRGNGELGRDRRGGLGGCSIGLRGNCEFGNAQGGVRRHLRGNEGGGGADEDFDWFGGRCGEESGGGEDLGLGRNREFGNAQAGVPRPLHRLHGTAAEDEDFGRFGVRRGEESGTRDGESLSGHVKPGNELTGGRGGFRGSHRGGVAHKFGHRLGGRRGDGSGDCGMLFRDRELQREVRRTNWRCREFDRGDGAGKAQEFGDRLGDECGKGSGNH